MPSYNHAPYLEQRLESIFKQTFKDWKLILIDDHSTDNSLDILDRYFNKYPDKISYFIKNEKNSGSGYKSWQKGIELSTTEFIWIAETDDFCEPNFLELAVKALESNRNAVLAFTASNYVDDNGEFLYDSSKRFSKLNLNKNEIQTFSGKIVTKDLPQNPLITNGSSVVFRKPKETIPDFIFQHIQISDIFLYNYLLQDKEVIVINKYLNYFRQHKQSTTAKNNQNINTKIYTEYCYFVNYFNSSNTKQKEIIAHYAKHCLLPNRKRNGYLNLKPLTKLEGVLWWRKMKIVIAAYVNFAIKKLKFWN